MGRGGAVSSNGVGVAEARQGEANGADRLGSGASTLHADMPERARGPPGDLPSGPEPSARKAKGR